MNNPNDSFVVAGAGGWLGRRLVYALEAGLPDYPELRLAPGACLRAFYRQGEEAADAPERDDLDVTSFRGDLREPGDCRSLCAGAENAVLVNTAGVIHPERVRDFYRVNVDASLNLLEAAHAHGLRRVVQLSSNSPIGCNPSPDQRFDEKSPYDPYQHYGKSKMQMELRMRERADELGMELVIVRPPWFYGPFQPERQTTFFTMIRKGSGPLVGDGRNRRSMVYVDNLCHGLMLAARVPAAAHQTYWIADEEPYEMRTILDTIEDLLETEFGLEVAHRRLRLPSLAAEIAYVADAAIQSAGLYHQKIHVLSEMNKTIACSIDKAKTELGYDPKVSLREGMRRSIRWCLDQGMEL